MGYYKPQPTHDLRAYRTNQMEGAEAFIEGKRFFANPYVMGTIAWVRWREGYVQEELDYKDVTPGYIVGSKG